MYNLNPIISIVIPSYNSIKTIEYTVSSILNQDCKLIKEIIIIDSSENDEVLNYLNSLNNKLIKVIKPGVRIMPAIGRNIGAKLSTGKILLFLDSDVILSDNYINIIYKAYCEGKRIGGGSIELPYFQLNSKYAIVQYYLQLNEFVPNGQNRIKQSLPGCNIFCDKELFIEAGCFPEIRASEDTQFCYRANTIADIWFIPEAKISHIFREDKTSFYSNQKLLGNYIGQNRKIKMEFISKTSLIYLLFPSFFVLKLLILLSRLIKANPKHLFKMFGVFNLILIGLYYWTNGFIIGCTQNTGNAIAR